MVANHRKLTNLYTDFGACLAIMCLMSSFINIYLLLAVGPIFAGICLFSFGIFSRIAYYFTGRYFSLEVLSNRIAIVIIPLIIAFMMGISLWIVISLNYSFLFKIHKAAVYIAFICTVFVFPLQLLGNWHEACFVAVQDLTKKSPNGSEA